MTTPTRQRSSEVTAAARDYLKTESGGAVLLLVETLTALVWANSPFSGTYERMWETELSLQLGGQDDADHLRAIHSPRGSVLIKSSQIRFADPVSPRDSDVVGNVGQQAFSSGRLEIAMVKRGNNEIAQLPTVLLRGVEPVHQRRWQGR